MGVSSPIVQKRPRRVVWTKVGLLNEQLKESKREKQALQKKSLQICLQHRRDAKKEKELKEKALEEMQKALEEKQKALAEKQKAKEEKQKAVQEKHKAMQEKLKADEDKKRFERRLAQAENAVVQSFLQIRPNFECGICLATVFDSIYLPCLHTGCFSCLSQNKNQHNRCHICRGEIQSIHKLN